MLVEKLSKSFKSALFFGCKVSCPICDKNFRTFLPYGIQKRENAQCVNCYSLERHRLLWLYLTKETSILNENISVLHVAPEKAIYDKLKTSSNINYTPVDKFEEGYTYADDVLNKDITKLDFPINSFDVIICNHVLEHIPDDSTAMKELCKVLKPGGWGILQVPIDETRDKTFEDFSITEPQERERLFGQIDHVRVYGKDYKDRLENAGFLVEVIDYTSELTDNEIAYYGLMKSEKIYLVRKG